jgi:hypothetical protein
MAKSPAWTRKEGKGCTKCGELLPMTSFYTTGKRVDGSPKYNSWCKTCVKTKMASYHKRTWGPDALQRSAFKRTKTVRAYLTYLRAKAVRRGGNCIALDELVALWERQSGRCALSGWQLTTKLGSGTIPTNCSIDRIDPSKGYEPSNVQLVCRAVNIAKSDLTPDMFLLLCSAIAERANGIQDASLAA